MERAVRQLCLVVLRGDGSQGQSARKPRLSQRHLHDSFMASPPAAPTGHGEESASFVGATS